MRRRVVCPMYESSSEKMLLGVGLFVLDDMMYDGGWRLRVLYLSKASVIR